MNARAGKVECEREVGDDRRNNGKHSFIASRDRGGAPFAASDGSHTYIPCGTLSHSLRGFYE
jgi:hypothetical protein